MICDFDRHEPPLTHSLSLVETDLHELEESVGVAAAKLVEGRGEHDSGVWVRWVAGIEQR